MMKRSHYIDREYFSLSVNLYENPNLDLDLLGFARTHDNFRCQGNPEESTRDQNTEDAFLHEPSENHHTSPLDRPHNLKLAPPEHEIFKS